MQKFIGILLVSGYTTVPQYRLYWSNSPDVRNNVIATAMSRSRFEEIKRFFHLSDNTTIDPNDSLYKVRPLFECLNKKFLEHLPRNVNYFAIDESMVPYFGRHSAKQFIRGKPVRFGYKIWSLATRLGYLTNTIPYNGKGDRMPSPGLGG